VHALPEKNSPAQTGLPEQIRVSMDICLMKDLIMVAVCVHHKRDNRYFSAKRESILYLTSSSLGTRNVGYSIELPDLPPVFVWPFVHLIPYLVLVAFSQIFSVGPPHMGHLKSFIYFHPKPRKSQE